LIPFYRAAPARRSRSLFELHVVNKNWPGYHYPARVPNSAPAILLEIDRLNTRIRERSKQEISWLSNP
jgi:hypothetical protein